MRKNYILSTILGLFLTNTSAQFTKNDVSFWIGQGQDSAVFLVDFNESQSNNSFAFGFLFDAANSVTGKMMMDSIVTNDSQFNAVFSSGFLSDITYSNLSGIGGTNGFYWSTYSGTNMLDLVANSGIGEILAPNSWFACSFTDYDQVTFEPLQTISNPIAAVNPTAEIADKKLFEKFKSYKNSKNELIIEGSNGTLMLKDINGKNIYNSYHSEASMIPTKNLNSGIYFLVLESNQGVFSTKIYL